MGAFSFSSNTEHFMSSNDKITVILNGKERELFMSFGLLNSLTRIVDDPSRVPAIRTDHELRDTVLAAALAERKPSGKIQKEIDLDDADITIEDVERTLDWVMEHVMSFFVRALKKVVAVTEANKADMEALASSVNGLKA
jgi:hypothetical protein